MNLDVFSINRDDVVVKVKYVKICENGGVFNLLLIISLEQINFK